ncbi:MAG TPA: glycosyltransferase family 4 protein [Chthoniobacterales bacterium]|jgi:glycosyltransferase involved in cell wall biosynthesis
MKILVFAHQLEVGGTQVSAIQLMAALRDIHGHDVVLFATPGPAVKLAEQNGIRYLPAPDAFMHPSPARMRALREAVRREKPDLIHIWDWWQCLDAYYIEHLLMRIPVLVTDMMMILTRVLPKALHTTFGTPELVDQAKAAGRRRAQLLLPPVDVQRDAPNAVDPQSFRDRYGINDKHITLVTVSRLDQCMKAESLRRTVAAVRTLGRELPLRYVIVGDGQIRPELEHLAVETNNELGRSAVVLTGELLDPRPAYAAADIVVGMGGSALRGMAFGKPVVIVGKLGFSAPFDPQTQEFFYYKGIFGWGEGGASNEKHVGDLRSVAAQRDQFPAIGEFSRQWVLRNFALEKVSAQLEKYCCAAVAEMSQFHVAATDGLRTAAVCLRERRLLSYRFWQRIRG